MCQRAMRPPRLASLLLIPSLVLAQTYTPTELVRALSSRDHPGYSGNGFDSTYLKKGGDDSYPRSLAALSAIAIAVGFTCILIYCGILCARRGVWKDKEFSRFSIGFTLDTDTYRLRSKGSRPVRFVIIVGFVCTAVLAFGCLNGAALVAPPLRATQTAANAMGTQLTVPVQKATDDLAKAAAGGGALQICPDTTANTAALVTAAQTLKASVGTSGTEMTLLSRRISTDGNRFAGTAVVVLVALVAVPSALGVVAAALSRSDMMLGTSGCGIAVLSFMVVSIGMMLSLVIALADFCVDPDKNAADVLTNMGKPQESALFQYFTTCTGNNPLPGPTGALSQAWTPLQAQLSGCRQPPTAAAQATALGATMQAAVQAAPAPCPPVRAAFRAALHNGLCVNGVAGLYRIWVAQTTAAVVFLCTLIFAAFVNLDKTDAELEEEEDTPSARSRRRRRLKEKRKRSRDRKRSHVKERLVEGMRSDGSRGKRESSVSRRKERTAPLAASVDDEGASGVV